MVFKGKTSFSYFGDIGLDDINIKEVAPGKTCDFWPTKASPSSHPVSPLILPPINNNVNIINNNSKFRLRDVNSSSSGIGYLFGCFRGVHSQTSNYHETASDEPFRSSNSHNFARLAILDMTNFWLEKSRIWQDRDPKHSRLVNSSLFQKCSKTRTRVLNEKKFPC